MSEYPLEPIPQEMLVPVVLTVSLLVALGAVIWWGQSPVKGTLSGQPSKIDAVERALSYSLVVVSALAVTCILIFVTRRAIFSSLFALYLISLIAGLSRTKYLYLENKLLFSDIYFRARDTAEIFFFLSHYKKLAAAGISTFLISTGLLACVYVFDQTRVSRTFWLPVAATMAATTFVLYGFGVPAKAKRTVFNRARFSDCHLSSFLISMAVFPSTMAEPLSIGGYTARAATQGSEPDIELRAQARCRPNIIVILHESSVDPARYFIGDRYRVAPSLFLSGDGGRRRLEVRAFGGATWISEYGVLLGVDTRYFAEKSMFLGIIGEGQFHRAFPEELRRFGYRTVANYPSPTSFLNTGRFFRSIGFEVVHSPHDMGISIRPARPRDRSYYEYLLRELAGARGSGDTRPTFFFVWTSSTHYPYDHALFPDVRSDEITSGDDAAEYARRQRIAADDLAWFEAQLARQFPAESFVIAGFGDHHPPVLTRPYFDTLRSQHVRKRNPNETKFKTYYRMNAINFEGDYSALSNNIQLGFLGESILSFARLPLSAPYRVRRDLRMLCRGKWFDCPRRKELDAANAALANGPDGLLVST